MFTRSRSRNSSKSYKSTSPSFHSSYKHSLSHLPSSQSIPQLTPNTPNDFIDNNSHTLNQLLKLLKQQSSIIKQHKQWSIKATQRIASNFQFAKSKVNSILHQHQHAFRKHIEKEYISFMQMFSQIKEGIRALYQQKIEMEKYLSVQKGITSKYKKFDKMQEYYGSPFRQNSRLVSQMQKQNEQRQDFRSLNSFYSENKIQLERLNHQAMVLLGYDDRLRKKEEQIGIDLQGLLREVEGWRAI